MACLAARAQLLPLRPPPRQALHCAAAAGRPLGALVPAPDSARQRSVACRSSGGSPEGLPANTADVADWAAVSFREAAHSSLTKACLLLALEEEAASQAAYAEAEGLPADSDAVRGSVGSAATWSLDRMQSLADDATRAFYQKLQELGVADAITLAAKDVPDSMLLTLHQDMVRSYPTQLILAINDVLYERHGYQRQRRWGDPRDSRLSNVLENGNGSPGSLAVLYLELCARLSLPLQPVALEGGRYFVLMPGDDGISLSAAGERFVIDPYSEGMLLSVAEVCELFEVEGELRPCTNEVMLAGILAVLMCSHWCAAVGCPPEPLFAVPISTEVALGEYRDVEVETSSGEDEEGKFFTVKFTEAGETGTGSSGRQQWWPAPGYNLQRALAAARKRSWLLPGDLDAQLEYAVLLYFDKQYEEAWQELGCVLQAARSEAAARQPVQTFDPEEVVQMEVLWEKIRLTLAFASP